MSIEINFEDTKAIQLEEDKYNKWLSHVCTNEGLVLGDVSIIITSDNYLLSINNKYLKHDYYTDIITFDYTEGDVVSGDLFISIDRIADNAEKFNTDFSNELDRVIVHGVLHLCGFGDKSSEEKAIMRGKENLYLKDVSRET